MPAVRPQAGRARLRRSRPRQAPGSAGLRDGRRRGGVWPQRTSSPRRPCPCARGSLGACSYPRRRPSSRGRGALARPEATAGPRTCSAPAASASSSGAGLARGRPPTRSGGCAGCSGSGPGPSPPPPAGPGSSGSGSGSESVCQVESQSSTVVGSRKLTPPSRLPIEEAAAGAGLRGCGARDGALGAGCGRHARAGAWPR